MISKGDGKSWCELPFDMEMLGFFNRSGLQIRAIFDEEVHFLMMVVGIVLPPSHGSLQMFSDLWLFFRLWVDKYVIKER